MYLNYIYTLIFPPPLLRTISKRFIVQFSCTNTKYILLYSPSFTLSFYCLPSTGIHPWTGPIFSSCPSYFKSIYWLFKVVLPCYFTNVYLILLSDQLPPFFTLYASTGVRVFEKDILVLLFVFFFQSIDFKLREETLSSGHFWLSEGYLLNYEVLWRLLSLWSEFYKR
jgi:hypothetical protein